MSRIENMCEIAHLSMISLLATPQFLYPHEHRPVFLVIELAVAVAPNYRFAKT